MKILHVVPSYIPAYRYGGPVKAVHELCRALARKGHEVVVYTTNINGQKNLEVPLCKAIEIQDVKVWYFPVTGLRNYCYSKELFDTLGQSVQNFDIVHIHSVYRYPTFAAAAWCKKYKKPYIINPFGALDPSMIKLEKEFRKRLYIKIVEKGNLQHAAFVHVASKYEKEKFLSLGIKVPVVVVPRGIAMEEYEKNVGCSSLREKHPRLKGKKIILFLGRIHFKKGLDLLAKAFREVIRETREVFLVIAGPDERRYIDNVKDMFRNLNLSENVIFTGLLLGEQKLSALYESDVFVLSSYGENFGIAALEAMTCKLPIVISNRVGLYPDVEEYKTGIVTDCDSRQIAEAILKLLDDEKLRRSMGENGFRLVRDRFSWDKVADRMIKVYSTILEKTPLFNL